MIVVAGYLVVDAKDREAYLRGCVDVVEQARRAPGCLDFSLAADLIDSTRVTVFERWQSREEVEAFRGDGLRDDLSAMLREAHVAEYEVSDVRSLTD